MWDIAGSFFCFLGINFHVIEKKGKKATKKTKGKQWDPSFEAEKKCHYLGEFAQSLNGVSWFFLKIVVL